MCPKVSIIQASSRAPPKTERTWRPHPDPRCWAHRNPSSNESVLSRWSAWILGVYLLAYLRGRYVVACFGQLSFAPRLISASTHEHGYENYRFGQSYAVRFRAAHTHGETQWQLGVVITSAKTVPNEAVKTLGAEIKPKVHT